VNNIARFDGTNWWALGEGVRRFDQVPSGRVEALLAHEGRLYVGVDFYLAGDQGTTNIAMWNGRAVA